MKEPLGQVAVGKLHHELEIIQKLADVKFVSQLASINIPHDAIALVDDGGVTLAQAFHRGGLDLKTTLKIASQLSDIVADVHRCGVVHKDINPANILLAGPEHRPILIDFDHATMFAEERPSFVHHNEIPGTLPYLAPEQTGRMARSVDHRADLYGLGATLYEMVVGKPPFTDDDPLQLIHQILTRIPIPPCELNPDVPGKLSQVIMRLLEKEPDQRYQSAEGLSHDLSRLLELLYTGYIDSFMLGGRDFPYRLSPPSRLIGREEEIASLKAAFENAINGRGGAVLVAGAPGIGKTALINELLPIVTERRGWFVSGKYDQYRNDVDSGAIVQALRALGRLLLAEPEAELAVQRQRILDTLGGNAGVITAFLPEFATLFGYAQEIMTGDPIEAERRFRQASLELLRSVSSPGRPVVLAVDDLQWARKNAYSLAEAVLTDDNLPGLLLVGVYRDNEIDATHPMSALLAKLGNLDKLPLHLHLRNLPTTELGSFIAEMLHLQPPAASRLAKVVGERTSGNPFETIEFINALRRDGVLTLGQQGWTWDDIHVSRYKGQCNVVDLLTLRISALPDETRELLKVMACLGGEVRYDILTAASGLSFAHLESRLAPALEDGVLVADHRVLSSSSNREKIVRFRHDRVQQSVYCVMEPEERMALYLAIARRLAAFPEFGSLAAEFYLRTIDRVTDSSERALVANLFRKAAGNARLLTNFAVMERFLDEALKIYMSSEVPSDEETVAIVEKDLHIALYSLGRFEEVDRVYSSIERRTTDPLQLVDAACIQINSLTNRRLQREAVALGLDLLQRLGIDPPEQRQAHIEKELNALYQWVANGSLADELRRPETRDPHVLAIAKLIHRMMGPAYFGDAMNKLWLVLMEFNLWLEHGPCAPLMSCFGGITFITIALRDDYRTGYQAALRALQVGERHGYELESAWVRHCVAIFTTHWVEPLEECIHQAQLAREGLLHGGDLQFTCFTYHTSLAALLDCAPTLDGFASELKPALAFALHTGNVFSLPTFLAYRQLLRALCGKTSALGSFEDTDFTEATHLERLGDNPMATVMYHIHRAFAAALFGEESELIRHSAAAMPLLPYIQGFYSTMLANLLQTLALATRIRLSPPEEHTALLTELDACRDWLACRANDAPGNFRHLCTWIDAERAWAVGDAGGAACAFDAALREAKLSQRPWHRAFVTERAGLFHLGNCMGYTGGKLLAEAQQLYGDWGATAKVRQLGEKHGFLSEGKYCSEPMAEKLLSTVSTDAVDLLAILRASQALSSETSIGRLQCRVMELLGTMTGATSVMMVIRSDELQDWLLVDRRDGCDVLTPVEIAGREGLLPLSVFRYAERTRKPELVENAKSDSRFARDSYILALDVCSLLAVPIFSQGVIRAILLLENRLSRNAFKTDRLDALLLIAGQLAVSIENAVLYASLERKVAERTESLEKEIAARRSAEELYRSLVEYSPNGILIVDPDTMKIIRFNSSAHLQLGYTNEEFANLTFRDLESEETRSRTIARLQAIKKNGLMQFETGLNTKQGNHRDIKVSAQLIDLSGCEVMHCILQDITDSRKMEREILKAQKLESLSILAGGIAHDFNNLLTGIVGNISIARMIAPAEGKLSKLLDNSEKASLRASKLTKQLLTFAKGGAPVKSISSLGEVVRESASFALRGSKVICEFNIAGNLWPCEADVGQIGQVISNLVINAEQAMPDGGLITVTCDNFIIEETCHIPLQEGRYLRIHVKDQGQGIPKELLPNVFDPFFTTKRTGVGLGLTTTYSIIKRHDGLITVDSESGTGTMFTIYLPACDAVLQEVQDQEHPLPQGGKKLLVMDDEDLILEVAENMLQSLGYDVACVHNGEQAVDAYQCAMKSGRPFDAVIMDLTIPGGMGGKEAVCKIAEIDPQVKAIVSSGYSNDALMAEYEKWGFSGILAKPYRAEDLSCILNQVLP
ncbi:MAG: AAA family ATPase [Geobacteraceae bacterium]|nr:AAA family ATPase [Geobacteraceae bacterium]